jgi:hypothetical protein
LKRRSDFTFMVGGSELREHRIELKLDRAQRLQDLPCITSGRVSGEEGKHNSERFRYRRPGP